MEDLKEKIKTLRELTGAPIVMCKNALIETSGHLENAKLIIEKKMLEKAREINANAGKLPEKLCGAYLENNKLILVDISLNSEIIKNTGAKLVEDLLNLYKDNNHIEHDQIEHMVLKAVADVREPIKLEKVLKEQTEGSWIIYTRKPEKTEYNFSIGSMITILETNHLTEQQQDTANKIATHIAFNKPDSNDIQSLLNQEIEETMLVKDLCRKSQIEIKRFFTIG